MGRLRKISKFNSPLGHRLNGLAVGLAVLAVFTWLCTGQSAVRKLVAQEFAAKTTEDTQWIWNSKDAVQAASDQPVYFRLRFECPDSVSRALLVIHCDNHYRCWLNGVRVGEGHDWNKRDQYEISALVERENILAVKAENDGVSPAGLSVALVVGQNGKAAYYYSGQADWKTSSQEQDDWRSLTADESKWQPAIALGSIKTTAPWAGQLNIDNVVQKKRILPARVKQEQFHLLPTDRLTWLGGTFVERLQTDAGLETQLYSALSNTEDASPASFQSRNLGWSGDDVWGTARAVFGSVDDGMARLLDDVTRTEPTVVALCYGANESFAGPEGLPKFRQGLEELIGSLRGLGATVVLITPPPFESLGEPLPSMDRANENLKLYCQAIAEVAKAEQSPLFDLNGQFAERWKAKSNSKSSTTFHFTENGIHLNKSGYEMANSILREQFLPGSQPMLTISELRDLVRKKNELYFHRYRPQNETYLFLFRKHEQGNNAVEIPQFDSLVNETEDRIRQVSRNE